MFMVLKMILYIEYLGVDVNLNDEKKINYNINIYELESNRNKFYFLENIKIRLLSNDYFIQSIKVKSY